MCKFQFVDKHVVGTEDVQSSQSTRQKTCLCKEKVPADSCVFCVCCFDNCVFEGFDDKQFPALSAYITAASASSIRGTESGSGGTGALDRSKTVGKGRMIEADRNGGRGGLIGGNGKSFEDVVDKGC